MLLVEVLEVLKLLVEESTVLEAIGFTLSVASEVVRVGVGGASVKPTIAVALVFEV